jgi:hypothetical protein
MSVFLIFSALIHLLMESLSSETASVEFIQLVMKVCVMYIMYLLKSTQKVLCTKFLKILWTMFPVPHFLLDHCT